MVATNPVQLTMTVLSLILRLIQSLLRFNILYLLINYRWPVISDSLPFDELNNCRYKNLKDSSEEVSIMMHSHVILVKDRCLTG